MNKINVLEDVMIVGGVVVSLSMIQTILGIVIMSVQAILICVKACVKIYNFIQNKQPEKIEEVIDSTKEELDKLSGNKDGK